MGEEMCGVSRSWGELCFLRQWEPYSVCPTVGCGYHRFRSVLRLSQIATCSVKAILSREQQRAHLFRFDPVAFQGCYVGSTGFGITKNNRPKETSIYWTRVCII